jgi:hypothetical protein
VDQTGIGDQLITTPGLTSLGLTSLICSEKGSAHRSLGLLEPPQGLYPCPLCLPCSQGVSVTSTWPHSGCSGSNWQVYGDPHKALPTAHSLPREASPTLWATL